MISQDLFQRNKEEWSPFMDRLEKTVRRKKRAKVLKLAALAAAVAVSVFFLTAPDGKPEGRFLSAKIPLRKSPAVTVEGGYAVEKDKGVWMVFDTGVQK